MQLLALVILRAANETQTKQLDIYDCQTFQKKKIGKKRNQPKNFKVKGFCKLQCDFVNLRYTCSQCCTVSLVSLKFTQICLHLGLYLGALQLLRQSE